MLLEDTRASGDLPVKVDGTERDIEFVWVDSESSPEKGVKAVQRAIQRDGIEILAGGWHSSVGLAVIDVAMAEDIIAWAILPATVGISNKINDNNYTRWFKGWPAVGPMAALYVDRVYDFIDQGLWTPRTMKAALASEDTDWGHDWNDGVKEALEARGWEVVSVDVVKLDETEHRALLTKYKAADVSIVGFTISGAAAASSFVKQHQEAEDRRTAAGRRTRLVPQLVRNGGRSDQLRRDHGFPARDHAGAAGMVGAVRRALRLSAFGGAGGARLRLRAACSSTG